MDPRRTAFAVLQALEQSPQRLEKLLDRALSRAGKGSDPRDRALAVRLVYTVLRHRHWLDHLLDPCLSRPLESLDPAVRQVLRLGAAELAFLNTPDHAAVHAAVELAKATPARRGQTLVNAALRALARRRPGPPPPLRGDDPQELALAASHPPWMVAELLAQWPPQEVRAWLEANQQDPLLALRVNTLKIAPEELALRLAEEGLEARPHPLAPESLVLTKRRGPARELPGFREGLWQAQDPGATAVGHLLGVEPGMRVLDLCAGAGGKTGHLAALMEDRGELWAVDVSAGRLRGLKTNLARLGVGCVRLQQADATRLNPKDMGTFQRVLVDAPCTGLGTAGRRPDVRWRRRPQEAERLAELQLALLRAAADLLAPGGTLLYCTCTVTRVENQQVVARLLAERPELRPAWDRQAAGPAAAAIGEDGFFRTLPHRHGCDAFFAVRLVRQ